MAPVVLRVDSAVHWINHHPLDGSIRFGSTYPIIVISSLDSSNPLGPGEHSVQTPGMRKWVHFLAAARQFPAQKFKGKHGKQPV